MDALLQDVRSAVRSLRRSPGFTAVAMLTLAIAVGANAAILSVADAVLFRPLPYSDPDRLFVLQMLNPATGQRGTLVPLEQIRLLNEQHGGLSEAALSDSGPDIRVTTDGETVVVRSLTVSANYFDTLGVRAAKGRLFEPRDAGNDRVVVLSHVAWTRWFGADQNIVGRSVQLGGFALDVVGVLPRHFHFPTHPIFSNVPEVVRVLPPLRVGEKGGAFYPVVRLESGITRQQAQEQMEAILTRATTSDRQMSNPVMDDVRTTVFPGGHPLMWLLLAGAVALLLIGCANLANMLIVRGHRRGQELAVRAALGAGTPRLIRPIVFEALIVGLAAGALAVLVTSSTFQILARQVPQFIYRNLPIGVDMRVALIAIGLSLAGALVFSVVPAWRSAHFDVRARLHGNDRTGARRRNRFGQPMVVAQVALTIVLVFGAATAARAFASFLRMELGFNPENVVTIALFPPKAAGSDRRGFYVRALELIARRSDVVSVGAVGSMPFDGSAPDDGVASPNGRGLAAGISHVLPGYFETAGIRLIRGRFLDRTDLETGGSAVVSQSAARVLFPGADPLGAAFDHRRGQKLTVVGIVADVRQSLNVDSPPQVYVIPSSAGTRRLGMIIRVRDRHQDTLEQIRRELAPLAAGEPLKAVWWSDAPSTQTAYRNSRFQTLVLVTLGALALGLTALGVFGVISFLVTLRTREMSIRIAMGAAPASLHAFVLKQSLAPVAIGVGLGLVATQWAKGIARAQLFKIETDDPVMLAASVATVILSATAAAYLPARRASRIDPVQVLRAE